MEFSVTALITLLAGIVIGALGTWLTLPSRRNEARLRQERDEALAQLARHHDDVDHHFIKAADLVNQLTASYRAVHEHLSEGARVLCSEEGRRLAQAKSFDPLPGRAGDERYPGPVSQPLDYAPEAQGTLAEDFGLRGRQALSEADPLAAAPAAAAKARPVPLDPLAGVQPPRDYAEGCEDEGCTNLADTPASTSRPA